MTSGREDIPRPWDDRSPRDPAQPTWAHRSGPTYEPDDDDHQGDQDGGPPRGPNGKVTAAIAAAVVVVLCAGAALWWFAVGPGHAAATSRPIAATASRAPSVLPVAHPPPSTSSTLSPGAVAAYAVGSCFAEAPGIGPGKVELNPVPCGDARAVFVINRVVGSVDQCDSGTDYRNHGYEAPDETANVAYCASLVVPVDACMTLAAAQPIVRTPCGTGPGVVRVLAIESAPSAAAACTDQTNPDVWYYQSPTSGRFACVSRPAAPESTPTTPAATTS
jgi:hypothetical protein